MHQGGAGWTPEKLPQAGPRGVWQKAGKQEEPRFPEKFPPAPARSSARLHVPPPSRRLRAGEEPRPSPRHLRQLFSPSRLRASSKGTGTRPLTYRHSGSFPPTGGGRRTGSLERQRPGHCRVGDSTDTGTPSGGVPFAGGLGQGLCSLRGPLGRVSLCLALRGDRGGDDDDERKRLRGRGPGVGGAEGPPRFHKDDFPHRTQENWILQP